MCIQCRIFFIVQRAREYWRMMIHTRVAGMSGHEVSGPESDPNEGKGNLNLTLTWEMMPAAAMFKGLRQTIAPRKRSSWPNSIT